VSSSITRKSLSPIKDKPVGLDKPSTIFSNLKSGASTTGSPNNLVPPLTKRNDKNKKYEKNIKLMKYRNLFIEGFTNIRNLSILMLFTSVRLVVTSLRMTDAL
jgi:hypothetical protein